MPNPIAAAFVEVLPDTSLFRAQLQRQINLTIATLRVPAVEVPVGVSAGAGLAALATESAALSAVQLEVAATAGTATAAEGAYAAAVAAGGVDLTAFALANQAAAAAQAEVAATAGAATAAVGSKKVATAASGFFNLANESNAARGALIGLSRITPVAVFGLGLTGTAAIAAGLAIKGAITSAADFQEELNVLQAVLSATDAEMVQISDTAKQLGADVRLPATSATDAAVAMTELAKAGLSITDTLAAARGVLQLAAAANLSVGDAAKFAATELNAFELAGNQATHVADLLAGASIAAQGEVSDFALAFQQVAAVAHQTDVSLETTTGLLTELAKAGILGSDAGTSLRVALIRLVPSSKQAAEFQRLLGVQLDSSRSIGDQLPEVIDKYRDALNKLGPTQRTAVLNQIFGQDAIRATTIIFREGSEGLDEATKAADKQGSAAKLAEARTKGFNGAIQGLESNAQTLGITLGTLVLPALTDVVRGITDVISVANKGADALLQLGQQSGFLGNALHKVGAGLKDIVENSLPVVSQFKGVKDAVHLAGDVWDALSDSEENAAKKAIEAAQAARTAQDILARSVDETNSRTDEAIANAGGTTPGVDESAQAAAKNLADNRTKEAKALQKQIEEAINAGKESAKKTKILRDTLAPDPLQNSLLNAQIADSNSQELAADRAIEAFFQHRLDSIKKGTARYTTVLGSLQNAHAATQSVLDRIKTDGKSASDKEAKSITDFFSNRRDRLELALEAAQAANNDNAENAAREAIIKEIKSEIASGKLTTEQLIQAQRDLVSAQTAQKNAIQDAIKDNNDFKRSLLDLALKRAESLTPNDKTDDARVIEQIIKQDQVLLAQYKKAGKSKRDLVVQVEGDIIDLKAKLLDLTNASNSFSLSDLFKEALSQFNEFSSNIGSATGAFSGGQVRAAISGSVLAQLPQGADATGKAISSAVNEQLNKTSETNALLAGILAAVTSPNSKLTAAQRSADSNIGPAGFATAVHQRDLAKVNKVGA